MTTFRFHSDGTVDWCGLNGHDLAVVFRAYAGRRRVLDDHTRDLALDLVGACMALWELERT